MPSYMSDYNGWLATQLLSGSLVADQNVVTSAATDVSHFKHFGVSICCPGATPSVKFLVLGANATAEGMASPGSNEFVAPESGSVIGTFSDSSWHTVPMSTSLPYFTHMKIQASGAAGNGSDTYVCVKFFAKV